VQKAACLPTTWIHTPENPWLQGRRRSATPSLTSSSLEDRARKTRRLATKLQTKLFSMELQTSKEPKALFLLNRCHQSRSIRNRRSFLRNYHAPTMYFLNNSETSYPTLVFCFHARKSAIVCRRECVTKWSSFGMTYACSRLHSPPDSCDSFHVYRT
jgi:hypothetical protein